jgi:rare lipoprotein A
VQRLRVRINDRGPWGDDRRIIDLSRAAAEKLGIVRDGLAKVEVRVVSGPE